MSFSGSQYNKLVCSRDEDILTLREVTVLISRTEHTLSKTLRKDTSKKKKRKKVMAIVGALESQLAIYNRDKSSLERAISVANTEIARIGGYHE